MADDRTIIQTLSVAIVLLISAQVEGQQGSVSPPFLAAGTGDQNIIINCSIQNPTGTENLAWQYSPTWSHIPITIYTSIDNSINDPANFSAVTYNTDLQGVQYKAADLTIRVANPGQAADYVCLRHQNLATVGVSSFLVLDPIQCPAQDETEYTAGTMVNITCSVHLYNRDPATSEPSIELIKIGQTTPLQGVTTRNESTVTMTYQLVLAVEDDNTEYMCVVRFTNIPEYDDNCTMIYFILHEVTEITFDPPSSSNNPITVAVGDQVNCTANGRPAPTIIWYNDQGEIVDEGEQLTVTPEMQSLPQPLTLLCIANNSINGGATYASVEGNYTFIVGDAAIAVQSSAGVAPWVIAVAVVVPIVVLAAIGIAVFFIIRHRKKNKNVKKKKTTTNGSATVNGATNGSTAYSAVATQELSYSSPSRPPPTSAPRTTSGAPGRGGPPGPDSRNGAIRVGDSPGFGDLGVQTYGGSNQAVNGAYPTRNSAHGSNQALALGGVSMNPNPGYPRASNPALNSSVSSSTTRPNYPYQGSNSNINNTSLSMNQNPTMMMAGPQPNASYGRQPSIASSSGRSHASNYNSGQATDVNRFQNDLSSMHGSEV